MIKAVLFDMDGTLVDTTDIGIKIIKKFLNEHGIPFDEYSILHLVTGSWSKILTKMFKDSGKEFTPELKEKLKKDYTSQVQKCSLLPYAEDILEAVHEKTIMVLATFSYKKQVEIIFKKHDLGKYFDMVITCDSKSYNEKTNQINDIVKQLKLQPEECILVEDSHYGIQSGQHNGIFTIGVKHYFDDLKADIEVEDLEAAKIIILEKLNGE